MRHTITFISTIESAVYSGKGDKLYSEEKHFEAGHSLTGILVDVRFDTSQLSKHSS